MSKSDLPVIVIGSGFGGMASAVRMRAKGYKVILLEAHNQLGGRAAVFKQDGFTFDAGPTVITAPYLIAELFEMLGEDPKDFYELMPVDPFYRILYPDGSQFDYVGDEDRLIENIRKLSPEDVEGYKKLAEHSSRIFDVGYTQLADQPFLRVSDMLRVLPDMLKLENYKTVYALVSKYIKDERLRQAFSFEPLLVGGNPFQITSIYLLIHWLERKWGVHFVKGGTTALVEAFGLLMQKHNIGVRLNTKVSRIDVEEGKVRGVVTDSGERIACQMVISNADPIKVYSEMVDKKFRKKNTDRSLKNKRSSMGLFVAYFGTKKTYPELAHHTIVLGPRYKGLLHDIFNKKVLADDFSLYLHAPTRSDASMAPEGHECFYVLSPVPNNQSGLNWSEIGDAYCDKILSALEDKLLPGLRENLVTKHFVTPDYFEKTLHSARGAGFGIEPCFTQSAYFRFHNKSEDIEGLYFVGASTHPGAGVPGVLSSAKVLERLIPDLDRRRPLPIVQNAMPRDLEAPL